MRRTKSFSSAAEARKNFSKLTERPGNVYENKGPLWKTWEGSWNVTENKGAYWFNPGMLQKAKELYLVTVGHEGQGWKVGSKREALWSAVPRIELARDAAGSKLPAKENGSPSADGPHSKACRGRQRMTS